MLGRCDKGRQMLKEVENIIEEMCENYCKYPENWDEKKDGMLLNTICKDCPLNRLDNIESLVKGWKRKD